jgi:hypothetical protein
MAGVAFENSNILVSLRVDLTTGNRAHDRNGTDLSHYE